MPRKAYLADLQQLKSGSGIAGVSNVAAGDDDGEFRFTIRPEAGVSYEISALIPELSDYPSSHIYHIFGDDRVPANIAQVLETLPSTFGLSISDMLEVVVNAIEKDAEGDTHMIDSQFEGLSDSDFGVDGDDDVDDDDDDSMFGNSSKKVFRANAPTAGLGQARNADMRKRIRSDLKLAKAAGFKVGSHGPLLEGQNAYVSVSVRISKLGISEEAMQAWKISATNYLILVISYPDGYITVDDFKNLEPSAARTKVELRVGISSHYKPTLQEAIAAFTRKTTREDDPHRRKSETDASNDAEELQAQRQTFQDCFISRPLNELLNDRLSVILRYRYLGMPWSGAEHFYNDYQGKNCALNGMDYMEGRYTDPEKTQAALPSIVMQDHILDSHPTDPHSLPLLAMQFLLRHFVRCTDFCLVCHCRLDNDLEAIKPYVCDKPLCLYQYMSLGFGPSIEHEIISQPYVVDLLISFCYSSANGGKLKDFPNGLSLNMPPPLVSTEVHGVTSVHAAQAPTPAVTPGPIHEDRIIKAKINRSTLEVMFEKGTVNPVKHGDWICSFSTTKSESVGKWEHSRVIETHMFPIVKISNSISRPPNQVDVDTGAQMNKLSPYQTKQAKFEDFTFCLYNTNFDTLSESQKRGAIITQLDLLPPVKDLKEYLMRNRTATLSTWSDRISPTASGILRWIIASNRACIMQVDDPDKVAEDRSERLSGMSGWMQFRFAMGAPDKERRFMDNLRATQKRLNLTYPTLFAWHGSALLNWHSIIREGLHFNEIMNGRAYGNGVYHSLDYHTSYGYSGNLGRYQSYDWPSSCLKVTCAMALNEIVNAPKEFTSSHPHLVVQHLDWIQTRYLFVQCSSNFTFADNKNVPEVFVQDPQWTPKGSNSQTGSIPSVVIPMSAMPKSRRIAKNQRPPKKKARRSGTKVNPIIVDVDDSDGASIDTEIEDLNILLEIDDNATPMPVLSTPMVRPADTSTSTQVKSKFSGFFGNWKSKTAAIASKPPTDFQPGTLDYSKLKLLAQPAFATPGATKRLQKEYQSLVKVQDSTPPHELGWYTDPTQFNNVYQWIVEMHSFEESLPIAKQMKEKGIKSVVMEMRFGSDYPMVPPFVRVIKPRFLAFQAGGGGHVTTGGSICMELLTNSGWSAVSSIESVLLQVRLAISSTEPRPAQLDMTARGNNEYSVGEAIDAYIRVANAHGWVVPLNFREHALGGMTIGQEG